MATSQRPDKPIGVSQKIMESLTMNKKRKNEAEGKYIGAGKQHSPDLNPFYHAGESGRKLQAEVLAEVIIFQPRGTDKVIINGL